MNFDNAVRLLCLLYCVTDVVVSIMFCTCYFMLCLSTYVSLWLCCTVRNQAELFRDKTGVVLSGRLSRPPGFVEFTAVCAPVLPLVGTVFCMQFRRRPVLGELFRPVHRMILRWCHSCRTSLGSLCLNVDGERS